MLQASRNQCSVNQDTACHFAELTSRSGWWLSEQRQWVGVVIFYVRPPFLLTFANPLMKLSSTVWLLTPSHFPALRHHSIPFTNQFFFLFCPELMKSVGPFSEASVAVFSVQCPGCPPAPSVPLTHSCSHFLLNVVVADQASGGPTLRCFVFVWVL